MNLSFQSFEAFATYASVPAAAAAVWKAFSWFDGTLNENGNAQLSKWLQNHPPSMDVHAFPGLIEKVFGKRSFSFLFFFRSCLASLICITLLAAFYGFEKQQNAFNFEGQIGFLLGACVVCNMLPDYLTLIINKQFEKRIVSSTSTYDVLTLVLAASLLTSAIALLIPTLIYGYATFWLVQPNFLSTIFHHLTRIPSLTFTILKLFWTRILPFKALGCIFIYASLLPCLWMWLYVVAALSIKVFMKTRGAWGNVEPFLELQNHPFNTLGKVAGAVTFVAWGLIVIAVKLL